MGSSKAFPDPMPGASVGPHHTPGGRPGGSHSQRAASSAPCWPAVTGPGVWGHAQGSGLDAVEPDSTPATSSAARRPPPPPAIPRRPSAGGPCGLPGGFPRGAHGGATCHSLIMFNELSRYQICIHPRPPCDEGCLAGSPKPWDMPTPFTLARDPKAKT